MEIGVKETHITRPALSALLADVHPSVAETTTNTVHLFESDRLSSMERPSQLGEIQLPFDVTHPAAGAKRVLLDHLCTLQTEDLGRIDLVAMGVEGFVEVATVDLPAGDMTMLARLTVTIDLACLVALDTRDATWCCRVGFSGGVSSTTSPEDENRDEELYAPHRDTRTLQFKELKVPHGHAAKLEQDKVEVALSGPQSGNGAGGAAPPVNRYESRPTTSAIFELPLPLMSWDAGQSPMGAPWNSTESKAMASPIPIPPS